MTFSLFAAAIAFSTFAMVSATVSVAVTAFAPEVARRLDRYSPSARATVLFRLRMLPAALASLIAFAVALPIFIVYEPADSGESLARTLVVLAAIGTALVLRGSLRAARAWRATSSVRSQWQARGRRLDGFDTPLPVFAIDESFPTVAVVGVTRPVLFISERVLRECSPEEVRAMLRHESAHVTFRDNLKRFLIRACPDLVRAGSVLDRAWAGAAEEAADAAAVAGQPASAVELAQALIRVARLAPGRGAPELASAFYLGGSIESRVRRLISPHPAGPQAPTPFGCVMLLGGALCLAGAIVAAAPMLHQFMETLVSRLP